MLPNALFCTAMLAVVASTILSAGIAMTRAAIHRLAGTYVAAGYQTALQSVQNQLALQMQSGGLSSPLAAPSPTQAHCADPQCRYTVSESVQYTAITGTPAPSCDPAATNCASSTEANRYIAEGRVTARITVAVKDAAGDTLAAKTADVAVRTLHRAPYAVVAGFRDGSFDDVAAATASGDDGGIAAATPNPCSTSPVGTSDDTAIRVAYRNAQSNACSDASTFAAQPYTQASNAPPGWSP